MRRNNWLRVLLCAGFATIYIAGCGSADSNTTGEDVRADTGIGTSDDAGSEERITEDGITADEGTGDDAQSVTEQADAEGMEDEVTLEGRSLSILGDSISTYEGYIPERSAVFYPFQGDVTDVSQTWWARLLEDTGMELCSNGSSSGSTCVGDSLCIDEPKYGCSDYRISQLTGTEGKMPDVIIVYMGTNDLLNGSELGDNDGTKLVEEGMIKNFSDAYTMMLDKLESNYPAAQIYCCTLAQVGRWGTDQLYTAFINGRELTAEDYSKRIEMIASNKGIPVIDLYHCGIVIDNLHEMTSDGVHLTPAGMECAERAMLSVIE